MPCALSHALLVRVATLAFGYFHSLLSTSTIHYVLWSIVAAGKKCVMNS